MTLRIDFALIVATAALLGSGPLGAQMSFGLPESGETIPAECGGRNMMDELAQADPERHAAILLEAKRTPNSGQVFWKVEKQALAPSYLFGTVHVSDPRVTRLPDAVLAALTGAKAVLLEVADLSPDASAAALGDARRYGIFMDGRSLNNLLSEEDFATAVYGLRHAGIPPNLTRTLRPWMATLLLAGSDCERDRTRQGMPVLDMKIAAEAKARGIALHSLETIGGQLATLASIPEDQQLGMLRATLKYADRNDDLMETIIQLYLRRQTAVTLPFQIAMAKDAGVEAGAFAQFESEIVVRRNHAMAQATAPFLDNGGAFIAVGALHLSGAEGLVALFQKQGFNVTAAE